MRKEELKQLDESSFGVATEESGRDIVQDFEIPEGAEVVSLRDLLFFTIGGFNFCLPLVEIKTIVSVADLLIDLPGTSDSSSLCRGFLRHRRQEVPLLDLRAKLGVPSSGELPENAEALLLDYGVTLLGVLVDYVFNIETTSQGYVLPLVGNLSELGDEFLSEYVVYPGGGAFRLGSQTLFDDSDLEALSELL